MLDRQEICSLLAERKDEIQRLYGVTRIGLFGSFSRGEQREDSDIDIVVELESANVFRAFFGLKYYLERLLGKPVDLGLEHTLKPMVRDQVGQDILYV